jgi:autotransporter-associated beta strand protein
LGTSGSIAGSGKSLTMSGSGGTLVLSGTDTYSGGTIVTAGTLIAASENAIANGTNLTVGTGAPVAFTPPIGPLSAAAVMPVPEPRTPALLIAGLVAGLAALRRKETDA